MTTTATQTKTHVFRVDYYRDDVEHSRFFPDHAAAERFAGRQRGLAVITAEQPDMTKIREDLARIAYRYDIIMSMALPEVDMSVEAAAVWMTGLAEAAAFLVEACDAIYKED